ncbi:unnamed protein product, partial [Meganyctiphanes norvegica]
MWLRVVAALAVLVAAGLAAVPGTRAVPGPNDRRYPDYIVFPKVKCSGEGSFPHPRNCSWYYRCNDRLGTGFFWTTYYECEPGTVFSDELDQCVFPHNPKYTCKTNGSMPESPKPICRRPGNVCDTIQSSCQNYDTCSSDGITVQREWLCRSEQCEVDCVKQRVSNICPIGQLFSTSQKRCVKEPPSVNPCSTPKPDPECTTLDESCKTFDVCLQWQPKKTLRLCAQKRCRLGTQSSNSNYCNGQQLYDTQSGRCVNVPTGGDLCPEEDCTTLDSSCKDFDVCLPTKRNLRLCAKKRCLLGTQSSDRNYCNGQQLYDTQSGRCVDVPRGGDLCPEEDCTTLDSSCKDFDVCLPTKRNLRLCAKKRCRLGTQSSDSNYCNGQQLYDTQSGRCVNEPTGGDLCPEDCTTLESSCKDFDVCLPTKRNLRLCDKKSCRLGTQSSDSNYCNGQQLYDTQSGRCVNVPTDNQLCKIDIITCKTVIDSCESYDICFPTKQQANLCSLVNCTRDDGIVIGTQPHCPGNDLYNLQTRNCVRRPNANQICDDKGKVPKPEYPITKCTVLESSCEDFELCQPSRGNQKMCTRERCTRDGRVLGERDMCPTEQMYDIKTRRCAQRPSTFSLCKPPFTPLPPYSPPYFPITICTTLRYSCQTYKVCDPNQRTQTLCELESCSRENQDPVVTNLCFTPGLYYDLTLRRCVQKPTIEKLCTGVPPPNEPQPEYCSLVDDSCTDYDICLPTKRNARLCSLQRCRQGSQTTDRNICNSQQLYDTQTWSCVNKPTENQLCKQPICTTVSASCENYEICKPFRQLATLCSRERCNHNGKDIGENPHCTGDRLYSLQTRNCVLRPTASQLCSTGPGGPPKPKPYPITTCTTLESSCEDFEVCQPSRRKQRMCARESCTREGRVLGERDICFTQGLMYDLQTRKCGQRPAYFSLCKPPFEIIPNDTSPTPTTICTTLLSSCKTYKLCEPSQRTQTLCERESCSRESQYIGERSMCSSPGLFYDLTSGRCIQNPSEGNLCKEPTLPEPETCNILDVSCKSYDVCLPTKRNARLCALQRCRQGTQSSDRNICNSQQLYDTQTWTCVNKPTEQELCFPVVCMIAESSCRTYDVCIPNRPKQSLSLCERERCSRGTQVVSERIKCPGGQLYNQASNACVSKPR